MIQKRVATLAVVCMVAAIAAACSAGCLVRDGGPVKQSVEGPEFHQMTEGYDDRVVFKVIPRSDTPGTYVVNYSILRNGTTVEARSEAVHENISAAAPIVFVADRSADDAVALLIEVMSTDGTVLHTSTTSVGPVRSDLPTTPLMPVPQ